MKPVTKVISILVMAAFMGIFAMPQDWKQALPETFGIREAIMNQELHLGLDLQGGTQLDYTVDLRQAEKYNTDEDTENDVNISQLVEGVRTTLERRVNGLGVSEPNIYTAKVADEHHVIVELAGIDDINEAKAIVGKTIQLEFKEQKEEIDSNEKESIQSEAQRTLTKAQAEENFTLLGEKLKTGDGKITYQEFQQFEDEINPQVAGKLWNTSEGSIIGLEEISDGFTINEFQQVIEQNGFAIYKVGSKQSIERTKTVPGEDFADIARDQSVGFEDTNVTLDYFPEAMRADLDQTGVGEVSQIIELENKYIVFKLIDRQEQQQEVEASHILVSYQGAERSAQTRNKSEAMERAQEVLAKVQGGENFASLAGEYSDGPSASKGGDLGSFGRGVMAPEFEQAAFALETGATSQIIETSFGYHIIKKTGGTDAQPTLFTTQKITVEKSIENAKEELEALIARTQEQVVTGNEEQLTYERIFYSTVPNPWKSTGLDGSKFLRATVTFDQFGKPLVAIDFNAEGATLFAELTERNIGKPIAIFVGGVLVSAPNVNEKISGGSAQITGRFTIPEAAALAQDLNTGAISAPIILTGQHQIGATLGADALNKSILAGLAGLFILGMYMILQYRAFGLVANLALAIYAIILLFILKTSQVIGMPIILTLAGIAGIILSIGMAVDANILIFERVKEERASGKKMSAALAIGFERAWSSIRDSNVSSLITCVILAWFGSSIIRGFAINLAIGILVSMFTAITITRSFLYYFFVTKKQ